MGEAKEGGSLRVCFNQCSQRAFDRIPKSVRNTIAAVQEGIQKSVLQRFPDALPSSGFRCSCENKRVGGVAHSLHLLGVARDFVLRLNNRPLPVIPGLRLVWESSKQVLHAEVDDG